MRIRIQVGAILLAATFLATFLSILFGCYPVKKHWQINPDPGSQKFHSSHDLMTANVHRSLSTCYLKATSRGPNHIEHIN